MKDSERICCPHCQKRVADKNGLYQHMRVKHHSKAQQRERKALRRDIVGEREPSMGELLAQAQMERAAGLPLSDPWIDDVFGDYLEP